MSDPHEKDLHLKGRGGIEEEYLDEEPGSGADGDLPDPGDGGASPVADPELQRKILQQARERHMETEFDRKPDEQAE